MRYHLIKPLQWKILFIATILTIHLKAQRYYIEAFQIKHEERNLLRSKTYNKTPLACTLSNDEMEQDVDDCLVDRRKIFSAIGNSIIFQNVMFSQENVYGETEIDKSIEDNKSSCENGIIVAESSVPGAYQQMCMQLPERSITLKSTGDKISILQGTGDAGGGSVAGRTGVAVWNSCLLLVRLFDKLGSRIWKDKTVLELGCGTGLACIVAGKLGATKVYATDGNEEVVRLAQKNIERNNLSSTVEATKLQWGILDASEYYDTADIIIGSDLTYNSGSWRVLAETVSSILKPGGIFLYLSLGHSGFNVQGELNGFISVTQNMGLVEIKEGTNRWPWKDFAPSLNSLLQKGLTVEEQAIIDGTGGVRIVLIQRV